MTFRTGWILSRSTAFEKPPSGPVLLLNPIEQKVAIKKRKNSGANRNISRIDFKDSQGEIRSGGWEVRFHRRGKRIEKFFADNRFGGKTKSLAAAKEFRNETEAKLPKYSIHELSKNPSKRNQSGVVGVRRHEQTDIRGEWGYTYAFWVAQWTDENGARRTKSYSVNHYGEDKAYSMAVKARKKGMTERKKNSATR